MHKKLYFSIVTLALCITLLVGAFLVMPQVTQAKAPYTPISVTQPGQCTQLQALYDTQTCIMTVSVESTPRSFSFSVSSSGVYCYASCGRPSPVSDLGLAYPQGTTLSTRLTNVPIVIVAPLSIHGSLTITFTVSGPSNSVKTHLVVSNSCC